ncbi:MAG: DUF4157 domain-containing protein [Cyanobacteria bacterium P01_D01_bin.156]
MAVKQRKRRSQENHPVAIAAPNSIFAASELDAIEPTQDLSAETPFTTTTTLDQRREQAATGSFQFGQTDLFSTSTEAAPIQRQTEDEEETAQLKAVSNQRHPFFSSDREEDPQTLAPRDSGSPLPETLRAKMEQSFDTDFSAVRIHESNAAQHINALAYTQGQHIHFQPGKYNPDSSKGQELIGHELTHVVQQRAGQVAKPQCKGGAPINTDRGLETEADTVGAKAAQGEKVAVKGVGNGIQRKAIHETEEYYLKLRQQLVDKKSEHLASFDKLMISRGMVPPVATEEPAPSKLEQALESDTATVTGGVAETIEGLTGITGEVGTQGGGNSGDTDTGVFEKYFKAAGDKMSGEERNVLSGQSDMVGAAAGGVGNIMGVAESIQDWRKAKGGFGKSKAVADGLANVTGFGSNVAKGVGGYLTQKGGGDSTAAGLGGSFIDPALNSSDSAKFIGDAGAAGSLGLSTIGQAIGGAKDFKSWWRDKKKGIFGSKKSGGKGGSAFGRSIGRGIKSLGKIGKGGVDTALGISKLVAQNAADGGKIAGDALKLGSKGAITPLANLAAASGGLSIATGAMDIGSGGFKAFKATKRKGFIKGLQAGDKQFGKVSSSDRDAALAHLKEIQTKKQKRGAIAAAEGAIGVTAGALALTGAGAVVGAGLAGAAGASKLGRFAFNKIKQSRRDKAARKDKQLEADLHSAGLSEEQINNVFLARESREQQQYDDDVKKGGFSKFKAKFKKKMKADKTKSTDAKDQRYEKTAKTLLSMHESEPESGILLKLVNIPSKQIEGLTPDEKHTAIVDALKKR